MAIEKQLTIETPQKNTADIFPITYAKNNIFHSQRVPVYMLHMV